MNKKVFLYSTGVMDFVKAAIDFCTLVERTSKKPCNVFLEQAIRVLPLLYIYATTAYDLFEPEEELFEDDEVVEETELQIFIDEHAYESVRIRVAHLLGEYDDFLETFHPDMPFSDTPVIVTVSESLADIYQDVGNFTSQFQQENEDVMLQAMNVCMENFKSFWGQKVLNVLKALHAVKYAEDLID